ncbi:hypothetical protein B0T19DRAFT_416364 [Cercophora scortea]|uniref:Fe2OG dioxygenase domain-containing protein n=1 Tax=Cercophora scortea TaxID=314031 RepID=A0AAE0MIB5_9PEZI|nr:hypothetical protein B0T19DRAFT_416364 [Cercophora scortea]
MPAMFPISAAALPAIPTRQALIIIDLQNDFISLDGALPVTEPKGFADRAIELAKAFRNSGAGDVIWVRSEYERHRSLSTEGDQIVTSELPPRLARPTRGRQPISRGHDAVAMEADDEAFLSVSSAGDTKPACVRKGTAGAEFSPCAQEAVVAGRDIVFTKTHYSAFASGQQQLVQLLRGRFVTEMYVCGALSNVSIYATALDAGRHGYAMTVVEDCCGYRSEMRHTNAMQQLMQLTGSEVTDAESVIANLRPPKPISTAVSSRPTPGGRRPGASAKAKDKATAKAEDNEGARPGGSDNARQKSPPEPVRSQGKSTGLSPKMSKVTLNIGHDSPTPVVEPINSANPQRGQGSSTSSAARSPEALGAAGASAPLKSQSNREEHDGDNGHALRVKIHHAAPLEVDSASDHATSDHESPRDRYKRRDVVADPIGDAGARHSDTKTNKSPPRIPEPATLSPERTRIKIQTRRRPRRESVEQTSISESPPQKTPEQATAPGTAVVAKRATVETVPDRSKLSPAAKPLDSEPLIKASPSPKSKTATPPPKMADSQPKRTPSIISEPMCEGDTTVISNALSPALAADAFERLLQEVSWASMSHLGGEVPRQIAVQGAVDDEGNMPVYRHPSDESPPLLPFSPTVLAIKTEIEQHLGHPLNHVLIQHYRSGNDYISEHSDKTLDIVRGSFIANVSLGAERTMVFRTKRPAKDPSSSPPPSSPQNQKALPAKGGSDGEQQPSATPADKAKRQIQRAALPHNSLCRMGLATNMRWLHAIRQDKRSDRDKTAAELAYNGARISLTFRHIGTYLDRTQSLIWGQGATGKTRDAARPVVNGQTPAAVELLKAFGAENHSSEFSWEDKYGAGFDVLHMGTPKRFCAGRDDKVKNMRVAVALTELGIACAKGSVEGDVRFEDNDPARSVIDGHETVLRYLDAVYGEGRRFDQLAAGEVAKRFLRLEAALGLLAAWKGLVVECEGEELLKRVRKDLLGKWEAIAEEAAEELKEADATVPFYIAGGKASTPADWALWPVLHDIACVCGEEALGEGALARYYRLYGARGPVVKVLQGAAATDGGKGPEADGEAGKGRRVKRCRYLP